MAMEASTTRFPYFFKPMLGNFQVELRIPINFLKFLCGETCDEAVLIGPRGEAWHVGLKRDVNNSLWFEDGWHEFVKAHSISIGYFLVFRHLGKMIFDVEIFDTTACLKEYPPDIVKMDGKDLGLKNVPIDGSKRKTSECVKDIETISNFQAPIKAYNLRKSYLAIPRAFMKTNLLDIKKAIFLKNSAGRSWLVKICLRKDHRYNFSTGWLDFAHGNNLKEGDICSFELSSQQKNVICVSVF